LPEKGKHPLLSDLLALTTLREHYTECYAQVKQQREWIIELARLFEPCDKAGQPRTARQVKREVKQFLEHLEQEAQAHPQDADVIACIIKAVRHRWWGLFVCYRIPNVPSSNNELETFFKDMKHHQRRITGRKSVNEFILRYGPFAAYIDYAESFDDLLARLRQVKPEEYEQARQVLRKVQTRFKKLHRFRHHPDEFYHDLETRWEKAVLSSR
jgi:hypothetical protein